MGESNWSRFAEDGCPSFFLEIIEHFISRKEILQAQTISTITKWKCNIPKIQQLSYLSN